MIQALIKLTDQHRLGQINAGGRHQAHIDRRRLQGIDPSNLMVFQGSQQLALQRQRQVTDFVQVQGAAIGRAKPARPTTGGGATAAGMAKQLGLGELLADGAAINRHKQSCALTALMNLPRQQFLAGAHIALNQHCKTGRCQFLQLVKQVFGTRVEKHQRSRTNA